MVTSILSMPTPAVKSLSYISAVKPSKDYTLLLQKQPGTKAVEYELKVNGRSTDTFSWVTDKTIKPALMPHFSSGLGLIINKKTSRSVI